MEQGFLGTIGYIKANLMSSPALQDKGYSNENFYPGAENIPESEPKGPLVPPSGATLLKDLTYTFNGGAKITDNIAYCNGRGNYITLDKQVDFRIGNTIYNNGIVLKFLYCNNGGIPSTMYGSVYLMNGGSNGRLELSNTNSNYTAPYQLELWHSGGTNVVKSSRLIYSDKWYYARILLTEKPTLEIYDSDKKLIETVSKTFPTNASQIKFSLLRFGDVGTNASLTARFDLSESFYW